MESACGIQINNCINFTSGTACQHSGAPHRSKWNGCTAYAEQLSRFTVTCRKYVTLEFEWVINELYKIINGIANRNNIPMIDLKADELAIRAYFMNSLKENSVASVFPELIEEWDVEKNGGITPDAFSARNNKKVWWKCKNGHSWRS